MLSEEAIKEYQEIYEKNTGEKIPEKEARKQAGNLLNLFRKVYFDSNNSK